MIGTHCRMYSTAALYFMPYSIRAIATSTGALGWRVEGGGGRGEGGGGI